MILFSDVGPIPCRKGCRQHQRILTVAGTVPLREVIAQSVRAIDFPVSDDMMTFDTPDMPFHSINMSSFMYF